MFFFGYRLLFKDVVRVGVGGGSTATFFPFEKCQNPTLVGSVFWGPLLKQLHPWMEGKIRRQKIFYFVVPKVVGTDPWARSP